MVGRDQASRAGHVLDDEHGATRDVLAHVPRDRPRIGVKAAAGRRTHDDADGPARVEVVGRRVTDARESGQPGDDEPEGASGPEHHGRLLGYAPRPSRGWGPAGRGATLNWYVLGRLGTLGPR